jgi:hypothetical protein
MADGRRFALATLLVVSLVGCGSGEAPRTTGPERPEAFCERLAVAVTDRGFLELEGTVPDELAEPYRLIRAHVVSGSGEPPDAGTQAAYASLASWASQHCDVDLTKPANGVFVPVGGTSTTVVIPPLAEVQPAPLEVSQAEGRWVSEDGLADLDIGPEGELELTVRSAREFTCTGLVAHSTVVHRYEATVSSPVVCTPESPVDAVGAVEGVLELVLDPERDIMEIIEIPGGVSAAADAAPVTTCNEVSDNGLILEGTFSSKSCLLQRSSR